MKAWILHEIGEIQLEELEKPLPGRGEVLIAVKAAGICGSDIPRIYETGAHTHPLIPGHEFSGVVEAVGSEADAAWLGKRVGIFPLIPCRSCPPCANKLYEMCRHYDYLGSRRNGGFAEYAAVPVECLVELPDNVTFAEAAMLEPMAVAVHAMRRAFPEMKYTGSRTKPVKESLGYAGKQALEKKTGQQMEQRTGTTGQTPQTAEEPIEQRTGAKQTPGEPIGQRTETGTPQTPAEPIGQRMETETPQTPAEPIEQRAETETPQTPTGPIEQTTETPQTPQTPTESIEQTTGTPADSIGETPHTPTAPIEKSGWGDEAAAAPDTAGTVVVCGLGTIGLLLLMMLLERRAGQEVSHNPERSKARDNGTDAAGAGPGDSVILAIGNKDYQKQMVLELGLSEDAYCDSREQDVSQWLMERSGKQGVDIFFECVGKNETLRLAVDNAAPGGRVCLVGNPYSDMLLEKSVYWKILRNQLYITGTWNSSFTGEPDDDWAYVLELLSRRRIVPEKLITHRFSVDELEKGFQIMRDKAEDYVKIMAFPS